MGSSLFPSHGFAMEEHQNKPIQDLNLTGLTFKTLSTASASEEQSTAGAKKANWGNDSLFGSYGWSEHSSSSGLSSPFGSELGSTETDETESEEDEDFIAQLTRQMADYMLKDDDDEEEEGDVVVDSNDSDENRVLNYPPNIAQVYLYILKIATLYLFFWCQLFLLKLFFFSSHQIQVGWLETGPITIPAKYATITKNL